MASLVGLQKGQYLVTFQRSEDYGDFVMFETPEQIQELQRKLDPAENKEYVPDMLFACVILYNNGYSGQSVNDFSHRGIHGKTLLSSPLPDYSRARVTHCGGANFRHGQR